MEYVEGARLRGRSYSKLGFDYDAVHTVLGKWEVLLGIFKVDLISPNTMIDIVFYGIGHSSLIKQFLEKK